MADPEKCIDEKLKFIEDENGLDYYYIETWDVSTDGMFYENLPNRYQKKGKRKPFYVFAANLLNMPCTVKSRIWKTEKGNIHFVVGIPKENFKDKMYDCAPLTVPISVVDYLNSITDDPECYKLKFSNDFLCDHMKKNGGVMVKEKHDYCFAMGGLNIHYFPEKQFLRKEGILACKIANHCTKTDLTDVEKIGRELCRAIYKGMFAYDHPQQLCERFNEYLYVLDKQKRSVYRYNEDEGNYSVFRDGKEILVDFADGSFYDPDEYKSVVHRFDYFESEFCNGVDK